MPPGRYWNSQEGSIRPKPAPRPHPQAIAVLRFVASSRSFRGCRVWSCCISAYSGAAATLGAMALWSQPTVHDQAVGRTSGQRRCDLQVMTDTSEQPTDSLAGCEPPSTGPTVQESTRPRPTRHREHSTSRADRCRSGARRNACHPSISSDRAASSVRERCAGQCLHPIVLPVSGGRSGHQAG